jgi:hypothetical protein
MKTFNVPQFYNGFCWYFKSTCSKFDKVIKLFTLSCLHHSSIYFLISSNISFIYMNLLNKVKGISCDLVGFIGYVELNIPIQLVLHYLIAIEDTSIEIFNFCSVSQSSVVLFFLNSRFLFINLSLFLVFCSSSIFDYWFLFFLVPFIAYLHGKP